VCSGENFGTQKVVVGCGQRVDEFLLVHPERTPPLVGTASLPPDILRRASSAQAGVIPPERRGFKSRAGAPL
jgi:hypothetical protein